MKRLATLLMAFSLGALTIGCGEQTQTEKKAKEAEKSAEEAEQAAEKAKEAAEEGTEKGEPKEQPEN